MSAIKRDKLDAIFSDLVRERAGWKSELSGSTESLQCCHIYSRKFLSTRWHPWNAVCLTASEHARFTDRPVTFATFCSAKFGIDRMHELSRLVNTPRKFSQRERQGLYEYYKAELRRIKQERMDVDGRLEFRWPDPIPEAEPRKRAKKKKLSPLKKKVSGVVVRRAA